MSANPLDLSKVSGTSAQKTALESTLGASNAGLEFTITGGATYRWNGSSFDTISIGGAALVTNANGTMNGGWKVADMYHPARDVYLEFYFGADDALSGLLTAGSANNGLWIDQSYINPKMRSIVIVNGNASPSFSYLLQFSRNGLGTTTDDAYTVIALTASTAQMTQVLVPDTVGYDLFSRLVITPDVGQAGTQLQFKAYMSGRGG